MSVVKRGGIYPSHHTTQEGEKSLRRGSPVNDWRQAMLSIGCSFSFPTVLMNWMPRPSDTTEWQRGCLDEAVTRGRPE